MKDRNELVCICMDVRLGSIEDAVKNKQLKNIEEIGDETEAGTSCGACHADLENILKVLNGN